jgi:O-antigen biosynthesis protein
VRTLAFLLRLISKSIVEIGIAGTVAKIATELRRGRLPSVVAAAQPLRYPAHPIYATPATRPAAALLRPRILIAGILELPQCAKYRVWQKKAYFDRLGIDCTVVEWSQIDEVRNALQSHTHMIFYRVPGFPAVLDLIEEARRLGVPAYWEVDDLIFDREAYLKNRNLKLLDTRVRTGVLAGVKLFSAALKACGRGIASTPALAQAMRDAGATEAHVIENALDADTLEVARAIGPRRDRSGPGKPVTVVYGSGSNTHGADFACSAPALAALMRARCDVRFRLIGPLSLQPELAEFGERIERIPLADFRTYLELMAEADINLAPLELIPFNHAKSNIKFIEAAVLGVPSVCSPSEPLRQVIDHGRNGFLADGFDQWLDALTRLVDDAALRDRVGRAAYDTVLAQYAPEVIARTQVKPFVEAIGAVASTRDGGAPARRRPRLLMAGRQGEAFDGAAVAARVADLQAARPEVELIVLAPWSDSNARPYDVVRFEVSGAAVFAVRLPAAGKETAPRDHARAQQAFAGILDVVRPDAVDWGSIEAFGAPAVDACRAAGVPPL